MSRVCSLARSLVRSFVRSFALDSRTMNHRSVRAHVLCEGVHGQVGSWAPLQPKGAREILNEISTGRLGRPCYNVCVDGSPVATLLRAWAKNVASRCRLSTDSALPPQSGKTFQQQKNTENKNMASAAQIAGADTSHSCLHLPHFQSAARTSWAEE